MSYDVVTDNEHWFTLRVNAVRTQGSSDEMLRYYHINKDTGKVATLSSLLLTATGGYVAPFLLLLGLTVVALGLNLALRKP